MIKFLIPTHYLFITFIGFTIVLLLSGFTYKKISKNDSEIAALSNFYDLKAVGIDGEEISFSDYKGKKVLIVNVASKCGYTYQYAEMQKLQDLYGEKVIVLGFPSNDFLYQEPGSNEKIAEFCESVYGVTFQMFEKIATKGKNQSSVYEWLSKPELNGWNNQSPSWNFCKYLINEEGNLIGFFDARIKPLSDEITSLL
tara:strand:- start:206 stop:799 length:594 start_codon:yes stop_codon:yes gene_type:complete